MSLYRTSVIYIEDVSRNSCSDSERLHNPLLDQLLNSVSGTGVEGQVFRVMFVGTDVLLCRVVLPSFSGLSSQRRE
jgi:hypothetical protein